MTESQPVSDRGEPRTEAGRRLLSDLVDTSEQHTGSGTQDRPFWAAAVLAIEEEAAALAIDVERLARAIAGTGWDEDDLDSKDEWYDSPRNLARSFAAEYARLSDPTEPDRTEEEPR